MVLSGEPGLPTALWAIPVGALGGVGRHALDVAGVGIPGWRTVFLVPEGPVVEALTDLGAEVVLDRFGPAHGLQASARALSAAISATRAAVVHTHLSYADVLGALVLAARRPDRRPALVSTEHGLAADDLVYHGSRIRSGVRARVHQARLWRADALIAVSEATMRVARSKWRVREGLVREVVPNGVDVPSPRPTAPPGLHVVSLARLAPEKRLSELVDGFAVLAREHDEARLTLAGIGPLEDTLRAQVRRLGLEERVALPGFVRAGDLLAEGHVLGQLSVWENCSYSLLDAVAHGLGVVASPVGGNPEILPARCLVDPADLDAVARALAAQGLDPATRPSLPEGWPDVAEMTRLTAKVYAEVAR